MSAIEVGATIPPWTMERVDAQRMKTMAAILRDPYELHWDQEAVRPLGFDRVINQGPLNLSYVANMLMAWQGASCVRRLNVRFTTPVFEGDELVARGTVIGLDQVDGEQRATCDIRLDRGDEAVVVGTAVVALDQVVSS